MAKWRELACLGPYQETVDVALNELAANRVVEHIWAHDYAVWKPEATEITNRLGWLHSAEAMHAKIHRLDALPKAVRSAGYPCALLLCEEQLHVSEDQGAEDGTGDHWFGQDGRQYGTAPVAWRTPGRCL